MADLYLISTFQCGKLLRKSKPYVKTLLNKRLIDYVRDEEQIYRISLSSVMEFVTKKNRPYDAEYLAFLKSKINPWREVVIDKQPAPKSVQITDFKRATKTANSIISLGLPNRAVHSLINNGIFTVDQLTSCTASDLMKFHYFGRKTLKETRAVLAEHSLSLRSGKSSK